MSTGKAIALLALVLAACAQPREMVQPLPQPFVTVEGGVFSPGQNDMHRPYRMRTPAQKQVDSLVVSRYEVTIAEYMAFADEYPEYAPVWVNDPLYGLENGIHAGVYRCAVGTPPQLYPVTGVNWFHALRYCNWRSQREGLQPAYEIDGYIVKQHRHADGYRLPTTTEWEWLARGGLPGASTTFSGSRYAEKVGWCMDNSGGRVHPIGQLQPNELGLFDMTGNVAEWCAEYHYVQEDDTIYALAPLIGKSISFGTDYTLQCPVRGGSYLTLPEYLTLVGQGRMASPYDATPDVGFRLVRTAR